MYVKDKPKVSLDSFNIMLDVELACMRVFGQRGKMEYLGLLVARRCKSQPFSRAMS